LLLSNVKYIILAVLSCTIIKKDSLTSIYNKFSCTTYRSTDIDNKIIELAYCSYLNLYSILSFFCFLLILLLIWKFIFIIQSYFFFFFIAIKEIYLYNKVQNISLAANTILKSISINLILFSKIYWDCTTKYIICTRIVANNCSNWLCTAIFFKNWKQDWLLVFTTIAWYCTKTNKNITKLVNIVDKACTDS
jgi:hypothetical protein